DTYFNRHFRFDCDNPKWEQEEGNWRIDIGAKYRDPARYPIDFYLLTEDALSIVPVEALKDGVLPAAECSRWLAKNVTGSAEGGILPAEFAMRFSREDMVVGLPMT
ncbi:MAG: hypothetical protein LBS89_08340, partial [Zoogloeaceae bacterium]|nr:hypothetical protein [Zoogloeaceae bacterium]